MLKAKKTQRDGDRQLTGENNRLKKEQETSRDMAILQSELRRSRDQVRVLKATMGQFLRMGIFSEDFALQADLAARYSTASKSR